MSELDAEIVASVIIPCRNSTRTLGLQLEALSRQEGAPAFEVIIADNGSSDRLGDLVTAWRGRLALKVADASGRQGAAYARNVGIAAAAADKLLFCDSDDVVARDWVARACAALELVDVFSGPGERVADSAVGTDIEDIWSRLDAALPPTAAVDTGDVASWPIILGGNSGMRSETARVVRGYDAGLAGDIEDNDLAFRLQKAGFVISAAPGVRIVYRARSGVEHAFHAARTRGIAHVLLCTRHTASAHSPVLRGGRWLWEPIRVAASGLRMLLRPSTRDAEGLAGRAGLAIGVWQGQLRRLISREQAPPAVGLGLGAAAGDELFGRPLLILSPHLDDALFSAAELIHRSSPEVWTVFAGAPSDRITTPWDQTCGFAHAEEAIRVRRSEDAAAFAGTSASVRYLDCLDGAYTTPERRRQDLALVVDEVRTWVAERADSCPVVVLPAGAGVPVQSGRPNASGRKIAEQASASPLAPLVAMVRRAKHRLYLRRRRRASEQGLAVNEDHRAIRDAVGDVLAGDDRVELALMEDLPYLWWHSADDAVEDLSKRWGRPVTSVRYQVDRDWKYGRIHHYSSQLDVMDVGATRLSQPDTLPTEERLWRLPPP